MVDAGGVAALAGLIELSLEFGEVGVDGLQNGDLIGSIELRAATRGPIPPFGGNPSAFGLACQSGLSPRVRVIRRIRLLPLMAVLLLASCTSKAPSPEERERLAEQQRLLSLCQRHQQQLPELLSRLDAAQQGLARVKEQAYVPSSAPAPLDPEEQRRLTIYDQQSEQDQYEQAVDVWRRREAERRERWEAEQAAQQRAAVQQLNAAAQALRQVNAELLLPGSPPRLNSAEVDRFRSCQPGRFR